MLAASTSTRPSQVWPILAMRQETGASQHTGSEDAPKQPAPGSEKSDAKISRDGAKRALSEFDRVVKPASHPGLHLGLADFECSPQLRFHNLCDHNTELFPRFLRVAFKDCLSGNGVM